MKPVPYDVPADEPARPVKRAATTFLETLFTYEPGQAGDAARLTARGLPAAPLADAAPLLDDTARGRIQVVYPQLGGLTATRASIMAVVRLSVTGEGGALTRTRTLDLRLKKQGRRWQVTALASLGGRAPAGAAESLLARKVLAATRITLPDSARWDIRAGRVDDRILRMLLRLSREHRIAVTVLVSGHPEKVFGRASTSNHTRGRAVDIWAVDGRRVAAPAAVKGGDPVRKLMERAISQGSDEVGGPWSFAGAFTDTVHEDHVHIGFKRP
ncbi:hypothetical protein [Nonomuraea typhae]|uniref:hypothetical protein n=1 Tax=Nonomuraea typhae TaxID=2603600 RepID=UPI001FE35096|nr:hypothetical protein [Nonomuraea typhae]